MPDIDLFKNFFYDAVRVEIFGLNDLNDSSHTFPKNQLRIAVITNDLYHTLHTQNPYWLETAKHYAKNFILNFVK